MGQSNREAINAILHYENFDHVPVMHFGFWEETIQKWTREGHIPEELGRAMIENNYISNENIYEGQIARMLGFDDDVLVYTGQKGNWYEMPLYPTFSREITEYYEDGKYCVRDIDGVYNLGSDDAMSIPHEIDHTLKDRESWEKEYVPRLQWTPERLDHDAIAKLVAENDTRERHTAVYCGSMYGKLRNYWGIENLSYLTVDDPELLEECIDTIADCCYRVVEETLKTGVKVDFGHFWEDICYRSGPLVSPKKFRKLCGKHYRRITDLLHSYGVDIVSVDCDGFVENLVPIWLDNGVNTMFPVEYGAWEYDFSTLREKFGKELRGIGNINKAVLAQDRKAVDKEIERAKRLVDLGGFLPCFDHRIPPEADWDLTKYYCERMREEFTF